MESDAAEINTRQRVLKRENAEFYQLPRYGGGELQFSSVDTREVPR
jgi:hypothetical protein